MIQCNHCGAYLRDEAQFCDNCGWALVTPSAPPPYDPAVADVPSRLSQYQPPPPPPPETRSLDMAGIVEGLIMVVGGVILIIAGLVPEMSCSLVHALGGQCYTFLGYTYIEPAFQIVPPILLGFGALFILVGGIMAARGARQ